MKAKNIWIGVLLIIGLMYAVYYFGITPKNSPSILNQNISSLPEITTYEIECFNLYATINNCKNGYAGGSRSYIIDKEHRQVTTYSKDVTPVDYVIAHRCTITDKNNWNCIYDDEKDYSNSFGFANGIYFHSHLESKVGMTSVDVSEELWQKIKDNPKSLQQ